MRSSGISKIEHTDNFLNIGTISEVSHESMDLPLISLDELPRTAILLQEYTQGNL
jgi:hypothetical protein